MNILIDIGHPAHVHLFRNLITHLKKKHTVIIASRNKDITNELLTYHGLDHISLTIPGRNLMSMIKEFLIRDIKMYLLHWKYKFDIALGTSVSIGHLSMVTEIESFNFNEDDDDIVPLYSLLSYPFSTKIIIPECLRYKKWSCKRILHNSYHELAYLHPNNFTPNEKILKKYNLERGKYIIIRNSALKAHHDRGVKGLGNSTWDKIYDIIKGQSLIFSRENERSHKIDPWDMHQILAHAKLLISDSQSMTMEAAVLGVPSIRYNSLVGKISVLEELEHKYKLTCGFRPGQENEMIAKLKELLGNPDLHHEWQVKREKMLSDKVDFNQWMIDFFENEIVTSNKI